VISNRVLYVSDSVKTFHIFSLICIQRLSERGICYVIFLLSFSANVLVTEGGGRIGGRGGVGIDQ
jgi:hypothetical protein